MIILKIEFNVERLYKKIIISLFLINISAYALNFTIHENNSRTLNAIKAIGTIEFNDSHKLHQYISNLTVKKHIAIYLDSGGGSLYGGIKLGKYFKDHHIKTVIQGDKICASACALAFLGGRDYRGNKWMSSTTTSKLGFHSFSYSHSEYEKMNKTQKTVSDILYYGQEVNANMDIFIKLFATPSSKMYWFTKEEELNLGIKVWDIANSRFLNRDTSIYSRQSHETKLDFIKRYFTTLKKIPYCESWKMLSSSMKNDVTFKAYKKWWEKSIAKIEILETKKLSNNRVWVKLLYTMKNGKKNCSKDIFSLKKNNHSWLIASQKYKKCN